MLKYYSSVADLPKRHYVDQIRHTKYLEDEGPSIDKPQRCKQIWESKTIDAILVASKIDVYLPILGRVVHSS